jgi:hypothetical protein
MAVESLLLLSISIKRVGVKIGTLAKYTRFIIIDYSFSAVLYCCNEDFVFCELEEILKNMMYFEYKIMPIDN